MKSRKDGEVDVFGVVTDVEARRLVASLCGISEMDAVKALSGSLRGVEKPARLHPNGHVFERDTLCRWCEANKEKLAEATKPAIHKDAVGKLPHDVKLSEVGAYPGISFDRSGEGIFGHSTAEKLGG